MLQDFHYQVGDYHIFCGFYESVLWHGDSEYDWNYNERSNVKNPDRYVNHEVKDFENFCKDVCTDIAGEISQLLVDGEICTECEYESMSSPREYNFTTDKLNLRLKIDLDRLKGELIGNAELRAAFDDYLNAKYSSRSGFISFVENNVDGYFKESVDEYPDVMVDYWLLTKIYDTSDVVKAINSCEYQYYHWKCIEIADNAVYEYMVPVSESDWLDDVIRGLMEKDTELKSWLAERYNIPIERNVSYCAALAIVGNDDEIKAFKERVGMDWWYEEAIEASQPY